jgi:hypothetical protein
MGTMLLLKDNQPGFEVLLAQRDQTPQTVAHPRRAPGFPSSRAQKRTCDRSRNRRYRAHSARRAPLPGPQSKSREQRPEARHSLVNFVASLAPKLEVQGVYLWIRRGSSASASRSHPSSQNPRWFWTDLPALAYVMGRPIIAPPAKSGAHLHRPWRAFDAEARRGRCRRSHDHPRSSTISKPRKSVPY